MTMCQTASLHNEVWGPDNNLKLRCAGGVDDGVVVVVETVREEACLQV